MPSREGRKARTVRQQLWARRVDIPVGKAGTVSVCCVIAREIGTPAVSAPQTPFFPNALRGGQKFWLEIPGQEGLEVFDGGCGRQCS